MMYITNTTSTVAVEFFTRRHFHNFTGWSNECKFNFVVLTSIQYKRSANRLFSFCKISFWRFHVYSQKFLLVQYTIDGESSCYVITTCFVILVSTVILVLSIQKIHFKCSLLFPRRPCDSATEFFHRHFQPGVAVEYGQDTSAMQ